MNINILITGASGFVGRRIVECLAASDGIRLSVLLRNPEKDNYFTDCGIRVYHGDITNPESLKEAAADKDVVIHCAALMSSFDHEPKMKFYAINAAGTKNLLEACDPESVRQFLHISTAGVYGRTVGSPASEDAPYGDYLSAYEWSKAAAEKEVLKYGGTGKISWTILRPAQLYGAGMFYGWPQTIKAIREGRMLIPGGGRSRIQPLYIDDLVKAVGASILNKSARNRIYNLAGPETATTREVFDIAADILKVKRPAVIPYWAAYLGSYIASAVPGPLKRGNMRLLTPHRIRFFAYDHLYDISRAKQELGYKPEVGLHQGFVKMIDWCRTEGLLT